MVAEGRLWHTSPVPDTSLTTTDQSHTSTTGAPDVAAPSGLPHQWWRHAVIYQVYVRSFADSNGDGEGDLPGITARLPYLAELGVDALWLTPFYPSPLADGGYDVADYRDVDPRYGTLGDFDALVERAHRLGLRVVVDIVPNHTSSAHRWFQQALAAGPGSAERARYVFRDGQGPDGSAPPSDWHAVFGGSAWERTPDGQWYLHLFDPSQPDLDWGNSEVHEDFLATLRFWLDRGVDGFRIDVAHGLAKDLSEPLRSVAEDGEHLLSAIGGHNHPYWDRDEVHEIYREWRRVLDAYSPPRMACGEAWVHSPARRALYVRPDELHQAFNFDFLQASWTAESMRAAIVESLAASAQVGASTTWVLSNHDVMREATRYALPPGTDDVPWLRAEGAPPIDLELGTRRARAAALLMLALPGSAYVYQGEELGLPEVVDLPEDALQDPVWERSGHRERGRDGCRVPIPWSTEGPSYGFGTGGSWLPQPASWGGLSVAAQAASAGSCLALYREALGLRRRFGGDGELHWLAGFDPETTLAFRRETGLTCVVNFGPAPLVLPAGEVLLASDELAGGALPPDTAVWLAG